MGTGDRWLAKEGVKPDGNAVEGVNCSGCPSVFPGGVIYASSHVSGIGGRCSVI